MCCTSSSQDGNELIRFDDIEAYLGADEPAPIEMLLPTMTLAHPQSRQPLDGVSDDAIHNTFYAQLGS